MKYKTIYFFISLLFIIPFAISLFKWGFLLSIDFTGGTEIVFSSKNIPSDGTIAFLSKKAEQAGMDVMGIYKNGDIYTLRAKPVGRQAYEKFKTAVGDFEEFSYTELGPSIGKELVRKTLVAIALASLLILGFVALQFKDGVYGASAILAVFHDTLILLGAFSVLGHFKGVEVDALFVTAVLTTLSFSVHDTIVVYDRIRESIKLYPSASFESLVNKAVLETLSRSINNSMTIIFMLTALFLLGGETIRYFALALLIGTISGTYSSTFTAAPLLVVLKNLKKRKQ